MDLVSTLGYTFLWGYALFGLLYFTYKIFRLSYLKRDISDIKEIDGTYFPVSKQSLDRIFSDLNLYSI